MSRQHLSWGHLSILVISQLLLAQFWLNWEHIQQVTTVTMTFVQATFVLGTFVHISNISAFQAEHFWLQSCFYLFCKCLRPQCIVFKTIKNPRMVNHHPQEGHPPSKIYLKDNRLGIWHLDLTHKIKTSPSWTLKLSFSLFFIFSAAQPTRGGSSFSWSSVGSVNIN